MRKQQQQQRRAEQTNTCKWCGCLTFKLVGIWFGFSIPNSDWRLLAFYLDTRTHNSNCSSECMCVWHFDCLIIFSFFLFFLRSSEWIPLFFWTILMSVCVRRNLFQFKHNSLCFLPFVFELHSVNKRNLYTRKHKHTERCLFFLFSPKRAPLNKLIVNTHAHRQRCKHGNNRIDHRKFNDTDRSIKVKWSKAAKTKGER